MDLMDYPMSREHPTSSTYSCASSSIPDQAICSSSVCDENDGASSDGEAREKGRNWRVKELFSPKGDEHLSNYINIERPQRDTGRYFPLSSSVAERNSEEGLAHVAMSFKVSSITEGRAIKESVLIFDPFLIITLMVV